MILKSICGNCMSLVFVKLEFNNRDAYSLQVKSLIMESLRGKRDAGQNKAFYSSGGSAFIIEPERCGKCNRKFDGSILLQTIKNNKIRWVARTIASNRQYNSSPHYVEYTDDGGYIIQ